VLVPISTHPNGQVQVCHHDNEEADYDNEDLPYAGMDHDNEEADENSKTYLMMAWTDPGLPP
jgi:hypothetical protein